MKFILVLYFGQLCDLYENDSIFDKFECCLSGDGRHVATGSYRSALNIFCLIFFNSASKALTCDPSTLEFDALFLL
jgi:hypothetical protein